MSDTNPKLTVDERDGANYIDFSQAALRKWRREGKGPAYVRVGRSVRYRVDDLDAFLTAHRVETRDSR
jgi:Helix-turn-helix domain